MVQCEILSLIGVFFRGPQVSPCNTWLNGSEDVMLLGPMSYCSSAQGPPGLLEHHHMVMFRRVCGVRNRTRVRYKQILCIDPINPQTLISTLVGYVFISLV